jgi:hypothetical protein
VNLNVNATFDLDVVDDQLLLRSPRHLRLLSALIAADARAALAVADDVNVNGRDQVDVQVEVEDYGRASVEASGLSPS